MKTIFRLLCGWMAIALAACTGDELQQIEPLQKPVAQKTISVKAYTPSEQAATRLAFEDKKAEGLKLSWTAGDAFTADIGGEKVTFTYNESSKEFTADVNENFELSNGTIAYYPAYDGENFEMDFSRQTGQLNSATTYMKGVYEGDAFKFTHSTAILKASFSGLPQNATISSVGIDVVAGENSFQIAISQPANDLYINLPDIAMGGKLKFDVRTSDGTLYTATKTVMAEKGIETGVYYNTDVALSPAPVCNLPMGIEFNSAISAVDGYGNATSIVFEANVADETPATRSDSNYTIALAGNVLTISTPLSEFVFNADCSSMFAYLSTITAINFNDCINTANVMFMNHMFYDCSALESLDLSNFNTANVIDMANMFNNCYALTSLNVSSFNTENVVSMYRMFNECYALTSLDLSNFNTANVTSMENMFNRCYALTSLDLSNFNTSNVTNMSYMFNNCSSLTSLNVSSFNTENVMSMYRMFNECYALTSLDLSNFNTSNVTNMSYMFNNCSSLTSLDLSSFNFDRVADFSNMFTNLGSSVTTGKIPVYVTQAGYDILMSKSTGVNGSNAEYALACELLTGSSFNSAVNSFLNGKSLTKIKFVANSDAATTKSDANDENATEDYSYRLVADSDNETLEIHTAAPKFVFNADCFGMFHGLSTITAISFNDCVNTANVTNMGYMFYGCSALESLDLSSFNTENVTNMAAMFYECSALTSLDLSSFNTSNVEAMNNIFYGCSMLASLDLSSFNTANVEYMYSMFNSCSSLQSITFGNSFNTSNVTNMASMFDGCSSLESLDLSSFNTANVTDMAFMFDGCTKLTSLDLSSFNTEKVTDMYCMFNECSALTSLNVSSFNTAKVTDMASMFYGCSLLTSLDLSSFDTSKVTTMDGMFYDCFSISELKLINFDFSNVTDFDDMFYDLAKNNPQSVRVYVYVTQDSYNILKDKSTGINSAYAWFVNEEGIKYGN